ncbi:Endoglucanase EG-II [Gossypium arboreum]|uniref:Endoglucanase EG-II n=1 Tax=Gossypium arboreum TaxID=29729 RepID=A0A0B0PPV9_GOSAR|nr:Endoglucanase EG-II [Gossypium arboreum]
MGGLPEQRRTYFWEGLGRAVRELFILILKWMKSSILVDGLVIATLNEPTLCTTENTNARGKVRLPLHERNSSNNYPMPKLNHSWFFTMLKVPNGCFLLQQYLINSFYPNLFMRATYPQGTARSSLSSTSLLGGNN